MRPLTETFVVQDTRSRLVNRLWTVPLIIFLAALVLIAAVHGRPLESGSDSSAVVEARSGGADCCAVVCAQRSEASLSGVRAVRLAVACLVKVGFGRSCARAVGGHTPLQVARAQPVGRRSKVPDRKHIVRPGFPFRETCKCVCPPTTRAHDVPSPTSDGTRSGKAALPARRPDTRDTPATRTAPLGRDGRGPTTSHSPTRTAFTRAQGELRALPANERRRQ